MRYFSLLALPALAAALPQNVAATPLTKGPNPGDVRIKGITYAGTGCPAGSVAGALSSDQTYVTLIFDNYVASIGEGIPITANRKNCQFNIQLEYPSGFQFSILSADYRGYANLDAGIHGTQRATYYFSGQVSQNSVAHSFEGPLTENYLVHNTAISASEVLSPCGAEGLLNINTEVALNRERGANSTASGVLTNDSDDFKFTTVFYLNWFSCTK